MQWSHMLGVRAECRASGIGRELKLEQRRVSLAMGIDLMEWTFDPLVAVNAHLNFRRLGVVVEEYVVNVYGDSVSPLHKGAPTDRFIAQWRMRSPRVEAALRGAEPPAGGDAWGDVPWRQRRRPSGRLARRAAPATWHDSEPRLAVAIPPRFPRCSSAGRSWRTRGGWPPARSSPPISRGVTGSSTSRSGPAPTCGNLPAGRRRSARLTAAPTAEPVAEGDCECGRTGARRDWVRVPRPCQDVRRPPSPSAPPAHLLKGTGARRAPGPGIIWRWLSWT